MRNLYLCLMVIASGCSSRGALVVDGSVTRDDGGVLADHGSLDLPPRDQRWKDLEVRDFPPLPDLYYPVVDQALPPDAATFCFGPNKLLIDGKPLSILSAVGAPMHSTCCPGEYVEVTAADASGAITKVTFVMQRGPNSPTPVIISLSSPPAGWAFMMNCSSLASCAPLTSATSIWSGTVKRDTNMLGLPTAQVELCADVAVSSTAPAGTKPIRIWLKGLYISLQCNPDVGDQTCNYDPMISSLRGTCNWDGTCSCYPSATLMPNGKCK